MLSSSFKKNFNKIVGKNNESFGEVVILIMDEELHDVVIAVTDFHVLGNQIPLITGELTSVTAYSNSIRDYIPYRLICYSNG